MVIGWELWREFKIGNRWKNTAVTQKLELKYWLDILISTCMCHFFLWIWDKATLCDSIESGGYAWLLVSYELHELCTRVKSNLILVEFTPEIFFYHIWWWNISCHNGLDWNFSWGSFQTTVPAPIENTHSIQKIFLDPQTISWKIHKNCILE